MVYECDYERGPVSSMCSSGNDGVNLVCKDDECVPYESLDKDVWSVEISFENEINATDLNTTEIIEWIVAQTNVDISEVDIGVEVNDDGQVVRVIVFVSDEESAEMIAVAVNDIDRGDDCGDAIMCQSKEAEVVRPRRILSSCDRLEGTVMMATIMMLIISIFH